MKKLLKRPNILKEFVTTNDSKKRIVEQVIEKINKHDITLLNDAKQDYQLSIFINQPLTKGNYTYNADPKCSNSHDDVVIALCLAVDCFCGNAGTYAFGSTK